MTTILDKVRVRIDEPDQPNVTIPAAARRTPSVRDGSGSGRVKVNVPTTHRSRRYRPNGPAGAFTQNETEPYRET